MLKENNFDKLLNQKEKSQESLRLRIENFLKEYHLTNN
jgi:hypothetical protein